MVMIDWVKYTQTINTRGSVLSLCFVINIETIYASHYHTLQIVKLYTLNTIFDCIFISCLRLVYICDHLEKLDLYLRPNDTVPATGMPVGQSLVQCTGMPVSSETNFVQSHYASCWHQDCQFAVDVITYITILIN